jgi:alpha-tubulin suppressor-like RCC1 family protein
MILRSAALAALLLCLARSGMATEEQAFAVSAGGVHTCAVMQDTRVACWGENGFGQLGDGTTNDRTTPMLVPGLSGVIALATGDGHTCALKQNGSVACWG